MKTKQFTCTIKLDMSLHTLTRQTLTLTHRGGLAFLVLLPLARKHPWTIEGVAHHLCPRTRSPLTVPIVPSFFFTHVNLLSAPLTTSLF